MAFLAYAVVTIWVTVRHFSRKSFHFIRKKEVELLVFKITRLSLKTIFLPNTLGTLRPGLFSV